MEQETLSLINWLIEWKQKATIHLVFDLVVNEWAELTEMNKWIELNERIDWIEWNGLVVNVYWTNWMIVLNELNDVIEWL